MVRAALFVLDVGPSEKITDLSSRKKLHPFKTHLLAQVCVSVCVGFKTGLLFQLRVFILYVFYTVCSIIMNHYLFIMI